MLDRNDLVLNNTENKLLFAIYETLQEIKALLVPATAEQTAADFDSLKRNELMAMVKALPEKPDSWTRLPNVELIKLLKEGAK